MVSWECPTNPREASGLDPEAVHYDQTLPDDNPEGLARTVETVLQQYDAGTLADELVDLGEWYEWLHS